MENWYLLSTEEVTEKLKSDPAQGLSDAEVKSRQEKYGLNELIDRGTKSPWKILWEQLTGVMVLILIISAAISFFLLHEAKDAIVIMIIVILNAILGFTQEYQAEQAMAALKKMAVPHVRTRRNEQDQRN